MKRSTLSFAAIGLVAAITTAQAQAPAQQPAPPPAYGESIGVEMAKKIAAAALAEVPKIGSWPDCVAIVDPGGHLVYFERMDNASVASVRIAFDKARTAALFRRPSKVFQDALTSGRTVILGLRGATPLGGGVPIIVGGKLIGALGVSGGIVPGQDDKVAAAGLAAINQ